MICTYDRHHLHQFQNTPTMFLLVVPFATLLIWRSEIIKWVPSFEKSLRIHDGNEDARKETFNKVFELNQKKNSPTIILSSYEAFILDSLDPTTSPFRRINKRFGAFECVVFDEVLLQHREAAQEWQEEFMCLKRNHALFLTGVRLQENLSDLWHLLQLLHPELFDRGDEVLSFFDNCSATKAEAAKVSAGAARWIQNLCSPFVLCRGLHHVTLPPKNEYVISVEPNEMQKIMYEKARNERKILVFKDGKPEETPVKDLDIELRKIANHPYISNKLSSRKSDLFHKSAKMDAFYKLIRKLLVTKRKIVVFSGSVTTLHLIADLLDERNYPHLIVGNQTPLEDRLHRVEVFETDAKASIFLVSSRAASVGLNLQKADSVVFYDNSWNEQIDKQAVSRVYRIGQQNEVRVFSFVTIGTIEERIVQGRNWKIESDGTVIPQLGFDQATAEEERNRISKEIDGSNGECFV